MNTRHFLYRMEREDKKAMNRKNDLQRSLEIYQKQLSDGYIQTAYIALIKLVAKVKASFPEAYHTGNISLGYLDYTYFPFYNNDLKKQKLRFGVVLNHEKMRFELWLMGQNVVIQKKYWEILKHSPWNANRQAMPKYSVLEVVLESHIDVSNQENMVKNIIECAILSATAIQEYIKEEALGLLA